MDKLERLVDREFVSIAEINSTLNEFSIVRLEDSELAELTSILLKFPTIIDEVTTHPSFYKKVFDNLIYYHSVKQKLTPKLVDGQIQRIIKLRGMLDRYENAHKRLAHEPHEAIEETTYDINDVKEHFRGLDIYDGRRFRSILDGTTLAFNCPEIIPQNAIKAFKSRWYNMKQFHGDYKWDVKNIEELKEDGRRGMFVEGVSNLKHFLVYSE